MSKPMNLDAPTQAARVARARQMGKKGESRKMLVALREACVRDEGAAWLWTLYGARLAENGRLSDAEHALRHALWLRRTSGDAPRVRTTQALIDELGTRDSSHLRTSQFQF